MDYQLQVQADLLVRGVDSGLYRPRNKWRGVRGPDEAGLEKV